MLPDLPAVRVEGMGYRTGSRRVSISTNFWDATFLNTITERKENETNFIIGLYSSFDGGGKRLG